uniref:Uncharacterized protein n=1 Tax=Fervidobacterium thailandense TaxID=1008305 RepID=A0A7C5VNY5_9BACT
MEKTKKSVILNYMYEASPLYESSKNENTYFKSWRLVYKPSRFKNAHKQIQEVGELIENFLDKVLLKDGNKLYSHIYGCARWVEFLTRKEGGKEER